MKSRDYREIISSLRIEGLEERFKKHREWEGKIYKLSVLILVLLIIFVVFAMLPLYHILVVNLFDYYFLILLIFLICIAMISRYILPIEKSRKKLFENWCLITTSKDTLMLLGGILIIAPIATALIVWQPQSNATFLTYVGIIFILISIIPVLGFIISYLITTDKLILVKIFNLKLEIDRTWKFLQSYSICNYHKKNNSIQCGSICIKVRRYSEKNEKTMVSINFNKNDVSLTREIIRKIEEYASKMQIQK